MQSHYHQWVVLQALCSALMKPHPQWAVRFVLCCLQVSGNQEGSSPYYLVLMRVNEQWAVSPRVNYEVWAQRIPPWYQPVGKWPRSFFLCGDRAGYPISCCPPHSFQGCFRFCSSRWPRLSHFEEVKLIVSVINLILQHLLKGFTACQALCQILGNKIEWDEHLITSNS